MHYTSKPHYIGRTFELAIALLLSMVLISCSTPTSTPAPTLAPPTIAPAPTLTETPASTPTLTPSPEPPTVAATGTPSATSTPTTVPVKPIACNTTIDVNTRVADAAGDFSTVKPGDIVCINAGNRKGLKLLNFKGTQQSPITFINSGGKVVIDVSDNNAGIGIQLYGSEHIRITGSGDPANIYGIEIANGQNAGIDTNKPGSGDKTKSTEYVELDHIYIHNVGAGIRTGKNNDLLDSKTPWSGHQYYIHDNFVKTTVNEGMYIGTSDNYGSFPIYDVQVWNNRVEDAGYDGIQVRQAHAKVLVYNNTIVGAGRDPCKNGSIDNTGGFNIASGTDTGDWYNNTVIGARKGFYIKDAGNVRIYNNLVIDSGHSTSGLSGPECPTNVTGTPAEGAIQMINAQNVQLQFNTVVNVKVTAAYGISIKQSTGLIQNNILGGLFDNAINGTGLNIGGNLVNKDLGFFVFVNPGQGDFHLSRTSPAIKAAIAGTHPDVDKDGTKRQLGGASDVGAYQFADNQK